MRLNTLTSCFNSLAFPCNVTSCERNSGVITGSPVGVADDKSDRPVKKIQIKSNHGTSDNGNINDEYYTKCLVGNVKWAGPAHGTTYISYGDKTLPI